MRSLMLGLIVGLMLGMGFSGLSAQSELESHRLASNTRNELVAQLTVENVRLRQQLAVVAARCP